MYSLVICEGFKFCKKLSFIKIKTQKYNLNFDQLAKYKARKNK